jgi:hypothetical protein
VPRSGVSYSSQLEWVLAAVWANYQPDEFFEMDIEWQNIVVAAYRSNNQIEAVVANEQVKESQRKSRSRS